LFLFFFWFRERTDQLKEEKLTSAGFSTMRKIIEPYEELLVCFRFLGRIFYFFCFSRIAVDSILRFDNPVGVEGYDKWQWS
jgi:hypothetical protein